MPEFYLKQWAIAEGRLWRYHRVHAAKLAEGLTPPRYTGFEKHLYRTSPPTPYDAWPSDIIEKQVMAPLDDAAANVLVKLAADPPEGIALAAPERKAWARFLNALVERHPKTLAQRDALAMVTAERLVDGYRSWLTSSPRNQSRLEHALSIFDHRVAARNIVRAAMVDRIDDETVIDRLAAENEWLVFSPVDDDPFITSDCPLLLNAGMVKGRPTHVLTLPLGPQHLFVSIPRAWVNDPVAQEALTGIARFHNILVVESSPQALYTATPIADGKNVRLRTMVENTFGSPAPTWITGEGSAMAT